MKGNCVQLNNFILSMRVRIWSEKLNEWWRFQPDSLKVLLYIVLVWNVWGNLCVHYACVFRKHIYFLINRTWNKDKKWITTRIVNRDSHLKLKTFLIYRNRCIQIHTYFIHTIYFIRCTTRVLSYLTLIGRCSDFLCHRHTPLYFQRSGLIS